ncbi:MAG TPA: hypothetical protein VHZ03_53455 [Trebonia sp.]|nr:hypothetical protein [Trebonia sp.]
MKTASGATAVQVAWSYHRGSRKIEHIGSAHDDAELETLKAAARQRLGAGHLELDLGLGGPGPSGPLEIASSRLGHLLDPCRGPTIRLGSRRPVPCPGHEAGEFAVKRVVTGVTRKASVQVRVCAEPVRTGEFAIVDR